MLSIKLKYFTSRWGRFSNAIDVLGSFLFDEDGVLLYGSESIAQTASGLNCNLKFLLYPTGAAKVLHTAKSESTVFFTHSCMLVNNVVFLPTLINHVCFCLGSFGKQNMQTPHFLCYKLQRHI